jgi:hypothetical protein
MLVVSESYQNYPNRPVSDQLTAWKGEERVGCDSDYIDA